MKNKDAIKLFLDKEGKELRGKKNFNFIILAVIFLFSIVSIGFGSASMDYLNFKMNDPFVNWVDIETHQSTATSDKTPLREFVYDTLNQSRFKFSDPEENYVLNLYFANVHSGKSVSMTGRSMSTGKLMDKILDSDNCIERLDRGQLSSDIGLIMTYESLERLGFSMDNLPSFVYIYRSYDIQTCDSIGIFGQQNGFYQIAFPIMAIVKQLPGMNSFLFTSSFLKESSADGRLSWNITDSINNISLSFVGEKDNIESIKQDVSSRYPISCEMIPYRDSWNPDLFKLTITVDSIQRGLPAFFNKIVNENKKLISSVHRVYDFNISDRYNLDDPVYISVQDEDLDSIRAFDEALYSECGIHLEMTNVEAKENFNFVQRMGNVLSICIIFLSLLFICFFIYFMLSTHFQKIQMNLGTFKAFGISNKTIFFIYNVLLLRITLFAYLIAFIFVLICTLILNQFTSMQAGTEYYWINIFTWQNLVLLCMSVLATLATSTIVARNMLVNTPGDLIYNRTNN